jgi:tRNA-modifying protein YgfZ
VLTLSGPERLSWLHNISSQHVADLADGATVQNLSLDGQGRVEDHWIQTDLGGVSYLDTEPWRGEPLLAYLRKMVFWSDVVPQDAELGVLSLLGPGLAGRPVLDALEIDALPQTTAVPLPNGGFVRPMPPDPNGPAVALDVVAPRERLSALSKKLHAAGVRPAGVWAYEAHRVAGLRPRLGVDTDERTIPHEVGWIDTAVHLDKGCYRGQETVARVHHLGRPPRALRLLHFDGVSTDRLPVPGTPVMSGERQVGFVGTAVQHFEQGPIALGIVRRNIFGDTPLRAGESTVQFEDD